METWLTFFIGGFFFGGAFTIIFWDTGKELVKIAESWNWS